MCLGIPGKVVEVACEREVPVAIVDFGGIRRRVCIEQVPETKPGEYVLVHVGFALARIDEAEAARIFALRDSADVVADLEAEPFDDRETEVAIQVALLRHRMERALRDSEKRLEAILSSIGDAVIATDTGKHITFLNRAAEVLLGWKSERAKGHVLSDVLKGSPDQDGLVRIPRGRDLVPVEVVESPELDAAGRPTGYVIVARDASERLRAQEAHDRAITERAARAAAERDHERARIKSEISLALADVMQPVDAKTVLRRVAEHIVEGIASWCVLHVEGGAEATTVAAHTDPAKTPWVEELLRRWPPDRDAPTGMYAVIRTGRAELVEAATQEAPLEMASDAEHLEELRAAGLVSSLFVPLRARWRIIGALGLMWTAAARRRDEADAAFAQQIADRIGLALDNARLYREVEEAKAAAEQLYRKQSSLVRELERTVRFSEMFVGILGHDLRTPLSGITTAASVVLNRTDSERLAKPVRRILSSADRMSRMIDQILDFTLVRLGRGIPLQRRVVDLADVCRNVLEELSDKGGGKEASLEVLGGSIGTWDGDRLAQLVSNLASNALQHRQRGTSVSLSIDGTKPETVALQIQNRGAIPAAILPVIFEPLHGSERGKREGSSGLGLGLYISQQIAAAHGGSIRAESDPAAGYTRFTIDLPREPSSGVEQVFSSSGEGTAE